MSDSVSGEPILPEPTGTFHYQELIESRLGQPIATDIAAADAAKMALSPGAQLAAGRNAMDWSVEQVAAQLKLAPRQILSIEADDYDALPEAAIVRGFIRMYAKLVKLDPDSLVALISVEPVALSYPPNAPKLRKKIGGAGVKLAMTAIVIASLLLLVFIVIRIGPYLRLSQ
jgi:cytoskeletal protein RodZ